MSIDQGAAAPAGTAKSTPKLSHKRMLIVLESLQERPFLAEAALKAGIHRKTLEYWLKSSRAGLDGYDLEYEGVMRRFHRHCEIAMEAPFGMLLATAWQKSKWASSSRLTHISWSRLFAALRLTRRMKRRLYRRGQRPAEWEDSGFSSRWCVLTNGENLGRSKRRTGSGVLVIGDPAQKPEDNTKPPDPAQQWKAEVT